jgi:hypothetical protein
MRKSLSLMLATALVMGTSLAAEAALLYEESFNYDTGLVQDGPGPWNNVNFGGTGPPTFEAGSLKYPGYPTSGNRMAHNDPEPGSFPYSGDPAVAAVNTMLRVAGTYYITMLARVQGEGTGLEGLGGPTFHADATFGGNYIRPVLTYKGSGMATIALELNGTGEPQSPQFPVNVDSGDATLIALRVTNTGGTHINVQVAVDPAGLVEPDWDGGGSIVSESTNVSGGIGDGSVLMNRGHEWDEFRIGTKWGEVVPEPASLALVGLGGLAMLRRRR